MKIQAIDGGATAPRSASFALAFILGGLISLTAGCECKSKDSSPKVEGAASATAVAPEVSFKPACVLEGNSFETLCLAFSPDGRYLASGGAGSPSGELRLWDTQTGQILAESLEHSMKVNALAFSPDGTLLAAGGKEREVVLHRIPDLKPLRTLTGHEGDIRAIAFSPDGKSLASGGKDYVIRLWDVATGKVGSLLRRETGSLPQVNSLAFLKSGRVLVAGHGQSVSSAVTVWWVDTGEELSRLATTKLLKKSEAVLSEMASILDIEDREKFFENVEAVKDLSKSRREWIVKRIESGGRLSKRDKELGDVLQKMERPPWRLPDPSLTGIVFSPDYSRVAAGRGHPSESPVTNPRTIIEVRELRAGAEVRTMDTAGRINTLSWNADGTLLASGGDDGAVRVWYAPLGKEVATLQGHQAGVCAVALQSDGKLLASGDSQGKIIVWVRQK